MYEQYWNLICRPFENHLLPAFYFPGQSHEAARLKLRYAIENRLGTAVLSGGIGTGKTALASLVQHEINESCGPWVHLVFPQMPAADYLAYLAAKLGALDAGSDVRRGMDWTLARLESRLQSFAEQGRRPTIVIDEAHLIEDVRVFECLQLLTNFQEDATCPFSLVLVGGPSFLGRLERMPQFNERLAIRSVLEPLSAEETAGYVTHRLNAAGAQREIFEPGALAALSDLSGGIPRRINRLADLALLVGYAEHLTTISADEIAAVAEELPPVVAA